MASVASANRFAALANAPTSNSPKSTYKPSSAPEPSSSKPVKENGKPAAVKASAASSNTVRSRSSAPVNGSAKASTPSSNGHAHTNGSANGHAANLKSTVKAKAKKQAAAIDWEIPRKTLHSSIGFVVLYLYSWQPRSIAPLLIVLATGLVTVTLLDLYRLRTPAFAKRYEALIGPLMRQSEKTQINGVIWYLVGVLFVLSVYPRDVAVVSILTLSWSDTTASIFGRLFGAQSPKLPANVPGLPFLPFAKRKSLAGFLAAAITGFAIAVGFWWDGTHPLGGGDGHWRFLDGVTSSSKGPLSSLLAVQLLGKPLGLWLTAVILGLGGAVVEAVDLGWDDNLTLPIFTGALIWAWFTVAGYLS